VAGHVILFAGPMGAGKTTAIRSLSEIEVVSTEALNTERHVVDKATTTVGLDYGELTLGVDEKVRLYGAPGQRRFAFMWDVLAQRARGLMLLVNNDAPDPLESTRRFLAQFPALVEKGAVIVGISRTDLARTPLVHEYARAIAEWHPGRTIPVFTADPRSASHMRTLLMALVANVEAAELVSEQQPEVA